MKIVMPALAVFVITTAVARADDAAEIGFATVAAALEALRADPNAQFGSREAWTIVASRENGNAVLWSFTPHGHPAHPAVVKRTALERRGVGMIDLAALCHAAQDACDRLVEDFRQFNLEAARRALPVEIMLNVGVALNNHERLRVSRMLTEEGKAAEIRMDDLLKLVLVPSVDDAGGVTLWAATYRFDGEGYTLLSQPELTTLADGAAELRVAADSGDTFEFSFTALH